MHMVVLVLEKCPPRLKGSISLWLFETARGVWVGDVSERVRQGIWEHCVAECGDGRCVMVWTASDVEQGFRFATFNARWDIVDLDGLLLASRPTPARIGEMRREARSEEARRDGSSVPDTDDVATRVPGEPARYVVLDLETTGLDPLRDAIVEIGAVQFSDGAEANVFSAIVNPGRSVPEDVTALTGITDEDVVGGLDLREALDLLLDFIGDDVLVVHNVGFDMAFLSSACRACGVQVPSNRCMDTLMLARKTLPKSAGKSLKQLVERFDVSVDRLHRAVDDCRATREVYVRLLTLQSAKKRRL